jgi:CheY-like chemotaxis protein
MDGYETTELIRNPSSNVLNHHIPIIAVSADAFEQTKEQALAIGMNGFITKPINKTELFNCLVAIMKLMDIKRRPIIKPVGYSEIIDIKRLIQVTEYSTELVQEMLKLYLMEMPVIMLEMRNYASESNWFAIAQLAPKLRSIVGNLGLNNLKIIIDEIEKLCNLQEQLNLVPTMIEELALHLETIYVQLNDKIKKFDSKKH